MPSSMAAGNRLSQWFRRSKSVPHHTNFIMQDGIMEENDAESYDTPSPLPHTCNEKPCKSKYCNRSAMSLFRTHSMRRKRQKLEAMLQRRSNSLQPSGLEGLHRRSNSLHQTFERSRTPSGCSSPEDISHSCLSSPDVFNTKKWPDVTPEELGFSPLMLSAPASPQINTTNPAFSRRTQSLPWRKKSASDAYLKPRWRTTSDSTWSTESSEAGDISPALCEFGNTSLWSQGSSYNRTLSMNEYLYALLLQAVVNPLGAPDPGHGPLDLADHLQQVFEIDGSLHKKSVQDVQNNRPPNAALNVTVVEAKNLQTSSEALINPYCWLCLASPKTRGSPKGSPRGSPSSRRRKSSSEQPEVRKTQVVKATLHPQWNETFELEVGDLLTQELEVYVWNNDDTVNCPPKGDRPTGLKAFLRHLKQNVDFGRSYDDFIGQFRIPLRDIPAKGLDNWFNLYQDKKQKNKVPGKCRLRLELSRKQMIDQLDCAESDQCSVDDFHNIIRQLYDHAIKDLVKQHEDNLQDFREQGRTPSQEELQDLIPVFCRLPDRSRAILDQFAVQQHFPRLSQLLVELVTILELATTEKLPCRIPDKLLTETIVSLEFEWLTIQKSSRSEESLFYTEKILLSDMEMALFEEAATKFVKKTINNLTDIPKLFPPCDLRLDELNYKVSLLVNLLNLHIWTQNETERKNLSHLLSQRLQEDVRDWVSTRLEQIKSEAKEPVIPEAKLMVQVLREATNLITPIYSVTQYFSRIGIDFYKVVSVTIESRLAIKSQELMHRMDKYQVSYQKYRVNIRESSTVSLQLYFALRSFFNMVKSNISDRELFRLTLTNYQHWFETAVIFWLQTFREEGIRRMEKALEIDKDVVQVTSLVKYSNSSVDVLSCFSKMTTEWRQIDFADADICLLGVTKITDTICDGARQYAEKIESLLEGNCYYDLNDNNQFDVTEQLCITMNNIEHVRQYLYELPQLLGFDMVTQAMTIKHEDEHIGRQSLQTLHFLVSSANEDIAMRARVLMCRITDKMAVDLRRYTEKFTKSYTAHSNKSSIDPLLAYLETNLQVLFERLEMTIFPNMLQQIWAASLECFNSTMLTGRPAEYYEEMFNHLKSLKAYFYKVGTYGDILDEPVFDEIIARLTLNAATSEQLILDYLQSLSDDPSLSQSGTPGEYRGSLAVRMGYVQETGDNISIHITVVGGKSLPGINRKGLSNIYVNISLLPPRMFRNKPVRTRTAKANLNPDFKENFSFCTIPKDLLQRAGAVLVFTVWHEDTLFPNDVLGEVVIHLCDLPDMTAHKSIDDLSTSLLPVCIHPEPQDGPYQVLRERMEWDKVARTFLNQRRIMAGYESSVPLCTPVKQLISKCFRKQTINQHQVYGSAPIL